MVKKTVRLTELEESLKAYQHISIRDGGDKPRVPAAQGRYSRLATTNEKIMKI